MTRVHLQLLLLFRLQGLSGRMFLFRLHGLSGRMRFFAKDMRAQVPKTSGCNRILWDSFTTACDFESIEPVLCDVLLSHGIGYLGVVHRGSEGRPVLC